MTANFYAAWIGIALGFISGAIIGLFFYKDQWMGGYNSWQRRLVRLGHISFFGIAFINFMYVISNSYLKIEEQFPIISILLIIASITMPLVCFLSAYKMNFRQLFFIPATSLITGSLLYIYEILFY